MISNGVAILILSVKMRQVVIAKIEDDPPLRKIAKYNNKKHNNVEGSELRLN